MPIDLEKYNPRSLKDAVYCLYKNLDTEEKELIKNFNSSIFHHNIGRAIRNSWGLWAKSELAQFFENTYGLGHADDMSSLILSSLKTLVETGEYKEPLNQVEFYKRYWLDQNINPLTLEEIKSSKFEKPNNMIRIGIVSTNERGESVTTLYSHLRPNTVSKLYIFEE